MTPVALATQFPADHVRVRHELGRLLGQYQLRPILAPGLESEHALVGLHQLHSRFFHYPLYAGQRPRLGVGWVLMYEDSAGLDLFLVQLGHELHMPYALCQFRGLVRALWTERLELTERHTG